MKNILERSSKFDRGLRKLLKNNLPIKVVILKVLEKMSENPFDTSLRTHKVITISGKKVYSSRVSGDVRIIWDFKAEDDCIVLLSLGGHSGKHKVYQ